MGASAGGRRPLSTREEELLGLLAGLPDGDNSSSDSRELSFSDLLVDAAASAAADDHAPAPRKEDGQLSPGKQQEASAVKQQQAAAAAARERRQRRQRSSSRGSCGGSGDGVLLNFYVPGLRLSRSMTAPRPGRGTMPPGAGGQAAPATSAAAVAADGKARAQAPLGIGCWPALWGRGRDRRRTTAKACS